MTAEPHEKGTANKAGPYVHLGLSFHRDQEATKFDYTFDDDASSLGSSVKSGLRYGI